MLATESLSDTARSFVESSPHRLLIGADWVEAADGRTFDTIDPATGETIAAVAHAGAEDVDRAVRAAAEALAGPWAEMPASGRSILMNKLADLIEANTEELAQIESLDNGK
ncbi:MAG: aldehyde dehydrogenase, partial [Thermoleophilaceae bacterium]|nr:aldehyde dehydrogenase [Thermoleophilaceae bacterium]